MNQIDIVHAKIVLRKCSRKISASKDFQTEQDVSVTKKEELEIKKWLWNR